ncbi:lipopolysaccharide/colanic/teichoic acid biosynthesis glycosyltransferase [Streptomyces sp. 840.1]|uniref:sugar transferase n=1 Tax=Streptomyces sp. 840.1 TaxID=2485152 RepID=UPI000F46A77F|nr:sugar transferase [Streptomyces sp. 840.1]ROQ67858.1 lipopolysaccharide/colanic/teichoic acid biosynthesis glycosyltransferase [Streptomyces sp. 840.1]
MQTQTRRPRQRRRQRHVPRRDQRPNRWQGQWQSGWRGARRRPAPARRPWQPPRPTRTARALAALRTLAAAAPPRPTAKRALDLLLGSALLLLAAPALAAAALALAVRRRPGGVLDRSPRTGLAGRPFVLRSLRTRRLRLDVLSRLPHVVRGELSLVGPEPLAPGDERGTAAGARDWRRELKPGLTGLAQVRRRSTMPWDEADLLDQHYAGHHRAALDLAILAEAVHTPLRRAVRGLSRRGQACLSDTDHRLPNYSAAE